MSILAACAAVVAAVQSAPSDTLQTIVARGMTMIVQDTFIDVTFAKDGTYSALDGRLVGRWRVDGEKLCTTSNIDPNERCVVYPTGKKSGDTFEMDAPEGKIHFRIH